MYGCLAAWALEAEWWVDACDAAQFAVDGVDFAAYEVDHERVVAPSVGVGDEPVAFAGPGWCVCEVAGVFGHVFDDGADALCEAVEEAEFVGSEGVEGVEVGWCAWVDALDLHYGLFAWVGVSPGGEAFGREVGQFVELLHCVAHMSIWLL